VKIVRWGDSENPPRLILDGIERANREP